LFGKSIEKCIKKIYLLGGFMKILQINSVCGIGSTGQIVLDIHKTLLNSGHESYIAYGRPPVKNCPKAIQIGSKFDVYSHVALTRIFDFYVDLFQNVQNT